MRGSPFPLGRKSGPSVNPENPGSDIPPCEARIHPPTIIPATLRDPGGAQTRSSLTSGKHGVRCPETAPNPTAPNLPAKRTIRAQGPEMRGNEREIKKSQRHRFPVRERPHPHLRLRREPQCNRAYPFGIGDFYLRIERPWARPPHQVRLSF